MTEDERRQREADEELAEMLSREPDDPERQRWERDPRHRALARAHEAFVQAELADEETDDERAAVEALRRDLDAQVSTGRRPAPRRAGPRPWSSRWAWVATLAVVLGGIFWMQRASSPPGLPTGIERGGPSTSWHPRAEIDDEGSMSLSWQTAEAAEGYRLHFLDAGLKVVEEQRVDGPPLRLPPERREELRGAGVRSWTVTPLIDGAPSEPSAPVAFP